MTPLTILYRDDRYVAVNKPAGMIVHRSRWQPDGPVALQCVRDHLGAWVHPCHRLDRATAGVLLFALDEESLRRMRALFEERAVDKTYLAVVRGWTEPEGRVDSPMRGASRRGPEREAVTLYRRLATAELDVHVSRYPTARYSLVEAYPVTGRWHQIRRHLARIDHPVIGDTEHGDRRHNRFFAERFGRRLLLAATGLDFEHPWTGRPVSISAPLDAGYRSVLEFLGWSAPTTGNAPDSAP